MLKLLSRYERKLLDAGLADPDRPPLLAGLDDELAFNRADEDTAPLREAMSGVFDRLSINSLVLVRLAEPYRTMADALAADALERADDPGRARITPEDCETRTFLHDLPVRSAKALAEPLAQTLAQTLAERKCCVLPGLGIAAHGSVSPEQGFVTVSSACFACFVLFFSRLLREARSGAVSPHLAAAFRRVRPLLAPPRTTPPELVRGPLTDRATALAAMAEAGRATVAYGLVDSYFGNVSCLLPDDRGGLLLISQTGSSLDELEGFIDPCPLDGSSTACLTASSELSAHQRSYERVPLARTILHGHPPFTVILSMDCAEGDARGCEVRAAGECHLRCPEQRVLAAPCGSVSVVPGEVGTGPTGLCNTLPPALDGSNGAVVYGHGLFATGRSDFNEPFRTMLEVENYCRDEYFRRLDAAMNPQATSA